MVVMLAEVGEVGAGREHELAAIGGELAPRVHRVCASSVG